MAFKTKEEAQLWLQDVERNKAITVKWGIRAKRMSNAISGKFSRLVTEAQLAYTDDNAKLIENMQRNRNLIPKLISLVVLRTPWNVFFNHWWHWRWLNGHLSTGDMAEIMKTVLSKENSNATDFFLCMALAQSNNLMMERLARESTQSITRELSSDDDMTQSSLSTEQ